MRARNRRRGAATLVIVIQVRPATPADLCEVTALVAQAFESDPLMVWLLPDPATRREDTARWWSAIVAGYLAAGRGLVTADGHACLLWRNSAEQLPEVSGQPSVREVIEQIVPAERLPEVMRALAAFGALRPEQPYLYVHVVATRPSHQGQRLGSRLLEALDASDPGRQVTYLESTNPKNHRFYARNGFKAGPGVTLPGSAVVAAPFTRRRTGAPD